LRYFLVDGSIPAIEKTPGEMISLAMDGLWKPVNASSILGDEGSPEVTFEMIAALTARLGASLPEGVSNTDDP